MGGFHVLVGILYNFDRGQASKHSSAYGGERERLVLQARFQASTGSPKKCLLIWMSMSGAPPCAAASHSRRLSAATAQAPPPRPMPAGHSVPPIWLRSSCCTNASSL